MLLSTEIFLIFFLISRLAHWRAAQRLPRSGHSSAYSPSSRPSMSRPARSAPSKSEASTATALPSASAAAAAAAGGSLAVLAASSVAAAAAAAGPPFPSAASISSNAESRSPRSIAKSDSSTFIAPLPPSAGAAAPPSSLPSPAASLAASSAAAVSASVWARRAARSNPSPPPPPSPASASASRAWPMAKRSRPLRPPRLPAAASFLFFFSSLRAAIFFSRIFFFFHALNDSSVTLVSVWPGLSPLSSAWRSSSTSCSIEIFSSSSAFFWSRLRT
mmetsp:Transcript_21654/g.56525  ORF Transcript_21654/g.56525 Transcript_21654/m.56525 type:complete len:275 (+) Transcript_21654:141-965(+)